MGPVRYAATCAILACVKCACCARSSARDDFSLSPCPEETKETRPSGLSPLVSEQCSHLKEEKKLPSNKALGLRFVPVGRSALCGSHRPIEGPRCHRNGGHRRFSHAIRPCEEERARWLPGRVGSEFAAAAHFGHGWPLPPLEPCQGACSPWRHEAASLAKAQPP